MVQRSLVVFIHMVGILALTLLSSLTTTAQTIVEDKTNATELTEPTVVGETSTANPDAGDTPGSEFLLPPSTCAWISIADMKSLLEAIERTSFGRMLEDEKIAPFAEDLAAQIRGWLDEQKVQLGLKLEDLEGLDSGEICLAGILTEPAPGDDSKVDHASVMMVDVSKSKSKAAIPNFTR